MKLRLLACSIAVASALTFVSVARGQNAPDPIVELRTGDLVFQSSHSRQASWIEKATDSPYSHVGMIELTPKGPIVLEAVEPVKRTPWQEWWQRGREHRVTVMRLRDLTTADARAAASAATKFMGRHYDAQFDWGDDRIYCSELVAKAFDEGPHIKLGQVQSLGSLRLTGLGAALRGRFGKHVPMERNMITPASLAADPKLERVWSSYP